MNIGVLFNPKYEKAYREIFQIFKINWEIADNEKSYDVLIIDDYLSNLNNYKYKKIIFYRNAKDSGEALLKCFDYSLGEIATACLNDGLDSEKATSPILDIYLNELKEVLFDITFIIEIPPKRWGYKFFTTLTHDIDILSMKDLSVKGKSFWAFIYRCLIINTKRYFQRKITCKNLLKSYFDAVTAPFVKLFKLKDPINYSFDEMIRIENENSVKSSLYFIPKINQPGQNYKDVTPPENRQCFYNIDNLKDKIKNLKQSGWEIGVHGIDSWISEKYAKEEYDIIKNITNDSNIGIRMHWLYFDNKNTLSELENAGYKYDSTFGFNEIIGFKAGTTQVFIPLNCSKIFELPLNIQDGALLSDKFKNLHPDNAYNEACKTIDWAEKFGGVISILWHNDRFDTPYFWGNTYNNLINYTKEKMAFISNPLEIIEWFRDRRNLNIKSFQIDKENKTITITFDNFKIKNDFVCRVNISNNNIKNINSKWKANNEYIEILIDKAEISIELLNLSFSIFNI